MNNIGADSETIEGLPLTFQWYSKELNIDEIVFIDNPNNASKITVDFFRQLPNSLINVIVWSHNLQFDLIEYFYPDKEKFLESEYDFEVAKGVRLKGVYGNPTFAKLIFSGSKSTKTVTFLDTFAFLRTSLDNLAKIFCPDLPKLKRPDGIGTKRFKTTDKTFVTYAKRDAEVTYHIGTMIETMFRKYDVDVAVSAPHLASKVFKHCYLKASMPLPPKPLLYASLYAYHGGRNTFACEPGVYKNVSIADITSQYPYAMTQLPDFSDIEKYMMFEGPAKRVRPFGVYKISGKVKDCPYPILFDHSFNPIKGKVNGIWVTGLELLEACRTGEFTGNAYGFYYDGEKGGPLDSYAKEFFRLKDTATNKVDREFYKILLNSLYGKFVQKRQLYSGLFGEYNCDTDELISKIIIKGGSMFHPFIGTLITGHARVQLHNLEHKYLSLHSATDSVATQQPVKEISGLGGLKVEAKGDFIAYRNKLYILVNNGKIEKYALHGFRGKLRDLIQMSIDNTNKYSYIKVNKLKESYRRNLTVNKFEQFEAKVNLQIPADVHQYFKKRKDAKWVKSILKGE